MNTPERPAGVDSTAVIRDIVFRARQAMGSATKLAGRLKELGIGPEDGYSESAISNWINGRTMPPADVLLAAASIAGIPIGPSVTDSTGDTRAPEEWRAIVGELQAEVDELRTEVIHLYGQLGISRPQAEKRSTGQRRAEAG